MGHLFREAPPSSIEVVGAEGSYLIGKDGRKYLDFIMGWCVGNAGWNTKEILDALRKFKGPNYVLPGYQYERWEELAKELVRISPGKLKSVFRATGGTEAVELALKISRAFNKRKKFIAFYDAYHGQSLACLSLVGLHSDRFGSVLECLRLGIEDWEETREKAVKAIKKEEICAFISEPIICNLGVIVPPPSFYEAVQEACKETNTAFIMDEVATGFGRTGKWFATEHYELKPDIMTVAKGFSSGYGAIGAAMATEEFAESMRFGFSNYSTFGWLPICVEAALANIEYMKKRKLVEESARKGEYLKKLLCEFCEPEGKGLCVGFDTRNPATGGKCYADGLLTAGSPNRMILYPALDIEEELLEGGVGIIKRNY